MDKETKKLLLKDVCARLVYGLKAYVVCNNYPNINNKHFEGDVTVLSAWPNDDDGRIVVEDSEGNAFAVFLGIEGYEEDVFKPYLKKMRKMPIIDRNQYESLKHAISDGYLSIIGLEETDKSIDFLNENFYDYRGLIEQGLSLEAKDDTYEKSM